MNSSAGRLHLRPLGFGTLAVITVVLVLWPAPALGKSHRSSPIFAEAQGRCPLVPVSGSPLYCRHTIYGNVSIGDFPLPFRPWGIAYAYNCGAKPGSFRAAVGVVNLDGYFPETNFNRQGKSQRGYYMETGRANKSWHQIIPAYRAIENIELDTTCSFHVRAVYGNARIVAKYVPAIPK